MMLTIVSAVAVQQQGLQQNLQRLRSVASALQVLVRLIPAGARQVLPTPVQRQRQRLSKDEAAPQTLPFQAIGCPGKREFEERPWPMSLRLHSVLSSHLSLR